MSWPKVKLQDVAPSRPVKKKAISPEANVWQLNLDAVEAQTGRVTTKEIVPLKNAGSSTHWFGAQHVLYSKLRPYLNKVVLPDQEGVATTELVPLLPVPELLDRDYLAYYLRSNSFVSWVSQQVAGAKMPRVSMKAFWEHEIPLPPLDEQKRIAAILDKADAIRRKRQQAIQLADDFLKSVFLDMFGDPVTNTKGWEIKRMADVIEFKGGHQPPKDTFIYEPKEGYVRLIQIRDFKSDKYKTYIPEEKAKRLFEEDDVMIARYGPPVFQILRGLSGSYNVALMKAIPSGDILKDFIFYVLQLPAYHDVVVANSERTAGQTGVNLDLLNNFSLPLPPLNEQLKIVEKVRNVEKILKQKRKYLDLLNELFKSLSQKAFAGEL